MNMYNLDNNNTLQNNYTLGVNMNDENNLKYKIQAPNYDYNKINTKDLLPQNCNDDWNFEVPMQKISLDEANLLSSGTRKIGNNTQGNTLKNASTDLRGNIPNPKF